MTALNDVWTLDVSGGAGLGGARPMCWKEIRTTGDKPGARGYHTANLIGNIMVVIGGSDGKECFTDVWCLNLGMRTRLHIDISHFNPMFLNLDTLAWSSAKQQQPSYRRLAHTSTQVGSYIFLVGGHNAVDYVSDVLTYNLGKINNLSVFFIIILI